MITMNIQPKWFNFIKNGSKRIELRLNDSKRQQIQLGDTILFQSGQDLLKARVVGKYISNNFATLFEDFPDMAIFGDKSISRQEMLEIMEEFYPLRKQDQFGVVGIRIELEQ